MELSLPYAQGEHKGLKQATTNVTKHKQESTLLARPKGKNHKKKNTTR